MCRHLAYLGPQVTLRSVLTDPPYGLLRQSWAPRQQKHGTVNADGFGVGWYDGDDPVPARYRRAVPMWGDAPYAAGPWLFSHNGTLDGWPDATAGLAATLPAAELLALEARADSALAWALVLHRLRAGESLADALAGTVGDLDAAGITGRFNFLLTDGATIAATAAGDTLCYQTRPGQVVVASEPFDDEPGWSTVPDRTVLTARPGVVDASPLKPAG